MNATEQLAPASLDQALGVMASRMLVPIAGGTDIMVRNRRHGALPVELDAPAVFVGNIPELCHLEFSPEEITIGAGVTLTRLYRDPQTPKGLREALYWFASPAIRNSATLGGNICNASPAADTLPFLYAADATVTLASSEGSRTLGVAEFVIGPGKIARNRDELLVSVTVPVTSPQFVWYRKVAPRKSNALSKLSVYAQARITGPTIEDLRIAVGAVAPTVLRFSALEAAASGRSAEELRGLGEVAQHECRSLLAPIDDQRSTAIYRANTATRIVRHIIENELPTALENS